MATAVGSCVHEADRARIRSSLDRWLRTGTTVDRVAVFRFESSSPAWSDGVENEDDQKAILKEDRRLRRLRPSMHFGGRRGRIFRWGLDRREVQEKRNRQIGWFGRLGARFVKLA